MKAIFFTLLAAHLAVNAKPTGAPICKANATLVQAGMGPSMVADLGFSLTAEPASYTPGQPVTFTIDSKSQKSFKGLLLYLNKVDQPLLRSGTFDVPTGFQTGPCTPDATSAFVNDDLTSTITHTDPSDKKVPFKVTWHPGKSSIGDLSIRIVIALGKTSWQVLTPVPLPSASGSESSSKGSESSSKGSESSSKGSMSSMSSSMDGSMGWKKCVKASGSSTESSKGASMGSSMESSMGSSMESSMGSSMESSMGSSMESSMGSSMGSSMESSNSSKSESKGASKGSKSESSKGSKGSKGSKSQSSMPSMESSMSSMESSMSSMESSMASSMASSEMGSK